MKNFKNVVTAITLSSLLAVATTSASAGIIIVGRTEGGTQCSQSSSAASIIGLLMSDLKALASSARTGILMSDRSGLLMSDRTQSMTEECKQEMARAGILMSD